MIVLHSHVARQPIDRPRIIVNPVKLENELLRADLPHAYDGLLIVERIEGAAARSELRRGDVVLAIVVGGRQTRLETLGDFERVVAALTPGRQVTLLMQRGGTSSYISLRAGD